MVMKILLCWSIFVESTLGNKKKGRILRAGTSSESKLRKNCVRFFTIESRMAMSFKILDFFLKVY